MGLGGRALGVTQAYCVELAAFLENASVKGLRFGMVFDSSTFPMLGPVPAWEVFVNDSSKKIILETEQHAGILGHGVPFILSGGMSGGGRGRALRSKLVTLDPGEVYLKWRKNILYSRGRNGGWGKSEPTKPGSCTLTPVYFTQDESEGRWAGRIEGPPVKVEFTKEEDLR